MTRLALSLVVALAVVAANAERAEAHALGAEAKLKGGRVVIEAYYDDDTPAGNARVTVVDSERKTIAEGKTDEKGVWSFATPAAGKYRAEIDAGAGHRAVITLTVPKLPAPQSPPASVESGPGPGPTDPGARAVPPTPVAAPAQVVAGSPQSASPSQAGADDGVTISDGPTRAEFTGSRRLLWVGVGLGTIAAGLAVWMGIRSLRPRPAQAPVSDGSG